MIGLDVCSPQEAQSFPLASTNPVLFSSGAPCKQHVSVDEEKLALLITARGEKIDHSQVSHEAAFVAVDSCVGRVERNFNFVWQLVDGDPLVRTVKRQSMSDGVLRTPTGARDPRTALDGGGATYSMVALFCS